jgi:uncharacterized membrane protein YcaP (DUF421 family)
MHDIWSVSFPYSHFVIRAVVVYLSVLVLVRLGGKRQVGQMGVGEFVAILLISNAVQNSMNGGDNSITGGIILAAVIIGLSVLYAYAAYKLPWFESLVQGTPTTLIQNGKIRRDGLKREWLSKDELKTLLRRQGVHDLHDVKDATLESDGSVSVTRESEPELDINDCDAC